MFWIDHVGVVASDLDASVTFYTKLFGPPIDRVEWRGEHAANVARRVAAARAGVGAAEGDFLARPG